MRIISSPNSPLGGNAVEPPLKTLAECEAGLTDAKVRFRKAASTRKIIESQLAKLIDARDLDAEQDRLADKRRGIEAEKRLKIRLEGGTPPPRKIDEKIALANAEREETSNERAADIACLNDALTNCKKEYDSAFDDVNSWNIEFQKLELVTLARQLIDSMNREDALRRQFRGILTTIPPNSWTDKSPTIAEALSPEAAYVGCDRYHFDVGQNGPHQSAMVEAAEDFQKRNADRIADVVADCRP